MKKKILAISLVVSLVAIAALGVTLAYFTANDDATNTFTVGNIAIELQEPAWEATGESDADTVYPGEALDKDPTVLSTGANPCIVRVKVEMPTGFEGITMEQFGDDWSALQADGYYYYLKPIATDTTTYAGCSDHTTALFQKIRIPTTVENSEDTKAEFDVVVTAEALQAQGVFPQWADMIDGISPTNAPNYRTEIEFDIVKALFDAEF